MPVRGAISRGSAMFLTALDMATTSRCAPSVWRKRLPGRAVTHEPDGAGAMTGLVLLLVIVVYVLMVVLPVALHLWLAS